MAELNGVGTPTQEIIDQCVIDLCKEKLASQSNNEALEDAVDKKRNSEQQYKLCMLVKAETTQRVYSRINYCVSGRAAGEIGEITDAIDRVASLKDELNKGFGDLVKKIKETKGLMTEVEEVACRLERCIGEEQTCNIDLYNKITEINYGTENDPVDFVTRIEEIESSSNECYTLINQTFEAGVKVSGILTFIETDSLQAMGKNLTKQVETFKKDVDDNLSQATKDIEACVKEFNTVIDEVTGLQYDYCEESVLCEGIENTMNWLDADNCVEMTPEGILTRLEEICAKVMEDCVLPSGAAGEDCLEKSKDDTKSEPPRSKNDKSDQWPIDQ